MRILAVSNRYPPWSIGGYEAIAAAAIDALGRAGNDVRVLTTTADPSDRGARGAAPVGVDRELRWYWREHEFPRLGLRKTIALEVANARVLDTHLAKFAPDVVMWWAMGGMSLSLLEQVRRATVPAVGVVGDDWMIYGPHVDRWTRRFRGARAAGAGLAERIAGVPATIDLAAAARWIFISEHLRAGAGIAGTVAHPGVDPGGFRPRPASPWRWRLLYCGRIDPRKGLRTAIEALALLPAEASLVIDGDGESRHAAELAALAEQLGVKVSFQCSPPDQVAAVYADADAVLFPVTWEEPWGLVPLEAMSVGRPVVASSAGGGPAEYLRDGHNCLQFPPGDDEALAAALARVAADAELRERLIEGGRQTASRFTDVQFHEALERELRATLVDQRSSA